jgi:hypothetical protein
MLQSRIRLIVTLVNCGHLLTDDHHLSPGLNLKPFVTNQNIQSTVTVCHSLSDLFLHLAATKAYLYKHTALLRVSQTRFAQGDIWIRAPVFSQNSK